MNFTAWLFAIGVGAMGNTLLAQSSFALPRVDVVGRISQQINIQIVAHRPSGTEEVALVASVRAEIQRDAPENLADEVTAPSKQIMDLALAAPIPVEFEDPDYIRAEVRFFLYSIPLRISYLEEFPPATAEGIAVVRKSVDDLAHRVQAEMERQLLPLNIGGITKESIGAAVENLRQNLGRSAGDPFSASLSASLDATETNAFVADFAQRLSGSIPLIREQMGPMPATRPDDPMASSRANFVFIQILRPVSAFILEKTTDARKQSFDYSKIAPPGWKDAGDELARVTERLINEASTRPAEY